LGGKSAAIFLDDGDIDAFVEALPTVSFRVNGQACILQSRILAPRSRYQQVVEAVTDVAKSLVIGNPLDPAVTLGPMVIQEHQDRVLGYIDIARNSDARLITGGGRPADQDRGWFVEPTVFADVNRSDRLAQEEVFGPVLAVIPYDGDDEAVSIANDSNYGLAGSVWTTDERHGVDIARRIHTGSVGINHYEIDRGAPFGGMKQSGIGREMGPEGLANYLEYQSIYANATQLPG
jgi:acyl-CoA reductase-like NAD-dependent aldehyde dehydrogenase